MWGWWWRLHYVEARVHSSTNGVLKSRYQKMNIFVYILGRILPSFVSSARWSPILQAGWPWSHSMQMVCTEYTVCVEWTRTEVSSSPALLLLLSRKNSQNLHNPLWRALASKPMNQLSIVTPFYKWEAMSFHHILSDLVSDFGKGPKRGFKQKLF